jgi:hypothetical protein
MFFSRVVDCGLEPWSGQTKDYTIGICCFSANHAALNRKRKDWLAQPQDNCGVTRLPTDCCSHRIICGVTRLPTERRHEEHCGKKFTCTSCQCTYVSVEALLTHCYRTQHPVPDEHVKSNRYIVSEWARDCCLTLKTCNIWRIVIHFDLRLKHKLRTN